ncbi:fumarate hydratase [candidate division KSB1 bacterium]|nr:fumarate hydratase [candidate division KSB1 bacterium]RQW05531.1 MAG: fumarate hydratase [candidate division KSB1 bacterium]
MLHYEYKPLIQHGKDNTTYQLLTKDFINIKSCAGHDMITLEPEALKLLAYNAFREIAFFLRPAHLKQVRAIVDDPEASDNDRFVAKSLLQNAVISAAMVLPMCQDTGTATVIGFKGQHIWTSANDAALLSEGIYDVYQDFNLRYSQIAPLTMLEEQNTRNNLPAEINIYAEPGEEYKFLFIAKGGGSANKTFLFQQNKSLLTEENLALFLNEKIKHLGTAACPPYHIAVVIGGTSAEETLKTVKLASAKYYDDLPTSGDAHGRVFRDPQWEERLLEMARNSDIGAQFGGKYLALDVRVFRMPRHAASCPVGIGVSCNADRNIKAKITRDGLFLEQLEKEPVKYLMSPDTGKMPKVVDIDLNRPMREICAELSKYRVKTLLGLTGTLIVARDAAHAKLRDILRKTGDLPDYFKNHPIYYAGPAKTPINMPSGSFGPTTAQRMDSYMEEFMQVGGSLITIAKGNRGALVTKACKKYGGFYLGSLGGPAALLAQENIKKIEIIDFAELDMEAVRKITVVKFPAVIICDDKGNNIYSAI